VKNLFSGNRCGVVDNCSRSGIYITSAASYKTSEKTYKQCVELPSPLNLLPPLLIVLPKVCSHSHLGIRYCQRLLPNLASQT